MKNSHIFERILFFLRIYMDSAYLFMIDIRVKLWYNAWRSEINSCECKPKGCIWGKSGLHRARITANGRRGRPQGKCNRDIPPMRAWVRVERRGKSSPLPQVTEGACKPYPEQHRSKALTSARRLWAGGIEQCRQRAAKIDGCSRQNPAYRFTPFSKKIYRLWIFIQSLFFI